MPHDRSQGEGSPYGNRSDTPLGGFLLAIAVGLAYFTAARLGLALRTEPGVAVFWPAAGIGVGALIALGPGARLPVSAAVLAGTFISNLMIGRGVGVCAAFGLVNAGQTLLTAWLIERAFARPFKLEDVRQVLGFLVASAVGGAMAAVGAGVVVSFIKPATPMLHVCRLWFASCLLGIVTVAPLLIGLVGAVRDVPSRRELFEGVAGLAALAGLSVFVIFLPEGPWATALPVALVFPVLLWVIVRCRQVFAAAAAFLVALAVICSATFNIGHFGDTDVPLPDRVLAAQTVVLAGALLALVLAALFAERRRSEAALTQGKERLQLALDGAALGTFSVDIASGRLECDARAAWIHGYQVPPTTIKEGRRFVPAEDLERVDAALAEAMRNRGGAWRVEYRVVPPPDYPSSGEVRWIALEGSIVRDDQGRPAQLNAVTRDITHRKRAEQALVDRNTQLALAGKVGLVGSFAYDIGSGRVQVSPGYAAIHGLPEGTLETRRADWRTRVHPDDLPGLEAHLARGLAECRREHYCEYRIVRAGGEMRWIESRSLIFYDGDGAAQRIVGANIDVTQRKRTEAVLAESETRLADALAAGEVMAFEWDAVTGQSRRSHNASLILGARRGGVIDPPRNDFLKRVHPDDRAPFREHIAGLRRDNAAYALNFRFCREDGREVWLEETARAEFDAVGKLVRIKGLTRDITERKRTEERLRKSEREYRELLGALPAAIYVTDAAGRITYCNEAAIDLWGKAPEFGKDRWCDLSRFYHLDGRPMRVADCPTEIALKQGRMVRNLEAILERPDGTRIPVMPYPTPLHDAAGAIVGVVNMTVDIRERKQAELALAERTVQLELAGKAALVGTFAYDVGSERVQVSAGYAAIHGFADGTKEVSRSEWKAGVHHDDLAPLEELRFRTLRKRSSEYSADYRIVRPGGEVRWIDARVFVSYGADGRPQRVVGVNIDATARKRAEEHQRALNAELDHRVKNVLATVSAIITQTQEANASHADFVAGLDRRIKSLAGTHELLSRSHWHGVPLLEIARGEFAPYAADNIDMDGPAVTLKAEATQAVAMVLHELTTNAAKYGAFSDRSGRVSLKWRWRKNGSQGPLVIDWQEGGGPRVQAPEQSGYGTRIIRELIPFELGGLVELTFAGEGLRCRVEIPARWVSRGSASIGALPLSPLAGRGPG